MLKEIKNVGLVCFGKSREQKSDNESVLLNIKNSIEELGYNCTIFRQSDPEFISKFVKNLPDFAFNYLCGDYGEDGRLSGFFEVLGIPYSHPGVFHHCVSIDKDIAKILFKSRGIDVAEGRPVSREEILSNKKLLEYPYIIKPIDGGSSLATLKISSESDKLTEENFTYKGPMMCEEFIPGREFAVTLMNGKAIGIIELVFKNGFFDYEVKNSDKEDSFKTIVDPELPNGVKERILAVCEECYKAVKANSVSRIDLKYDPDRDRIVVLELNTIPGMTPNSFTPQALKEFKGISFSGMIKMLIDDGIEYWKNKVTVEEDWKRQGLYK